LSFQRNTLISKKQIPARERQGLSLGTPYGGNDPKSAPRLHAATKAAEKAQTNVTNLKGQVNPDSCPIQDEPEGGH
jgi:hypothetical protein